MRPMVSCVGVGLGTKDGMTVEALECVKHSDLLIGSPRMLALFSDHPAEKLALVDPGAMAQEVRKHEGRMICILFSGDIGFHSGATQIARELPDWEINRYCGISTVQYFCARLGLPWEDVHLTSAHGHQVQISKEVGLWESTFVLAGGDATVQRLCQDLLDAGMGDAVVHVGSNLGGNDEHIECGSASDMAAKTFPSLSCMLVKRLNKPLWRWTTGGIPDDLFVRGPVPMTKSTIRCAGLAKLRMEPGDTVWDVGAGTGSVSVEACLHVRQGLVCAIEQDPQAVDLIKCNARKFGCTNIRVTVGKAPDVLDGLPAPDAVFIGGSGGMLGDCLEHALCTNPAVRLVATAVTLETVAKAVSLLEDLGCLEVDATMVSVTHAVKRGKAHLMHAETPVWIISARGKGGTA